MPIDTRNVAVTDKYGFNIVTVIVDVVMISLVALLWMRELGTKPFGNLNRRTAWLIPLVIVFCYGGLW